MASSRGADESALVADRGKESDSNFDVSDGPDRAVVRRDEDEGVVELADPFLGGDGVARRSDAFPSRATLLPSVAFIELTTGEGMGAALSFPSML
jgi:hypothetical protein